MPRAGTPQLFEFKQHVGGGHEQESWPQEDMDKLLHLYFTGISLRSISKRLGRTESSVQSKLWKICTNYKLQGYNDSSQRVQRSNKSWSGRDDYVLGLCRRHKQKPSYVAGILARPKQQVLDRVRQEKKQKVKRNKLLDLKAQTNDLKQTAPEVRTQSETTIEEDVLCAHRYLYYVKNKPVIGDEQYDGLEKEYTEFGKISANSPVKLPGSDKADDYTEHVRALAMYLLFKFGRRV